MVSRRFCFKEACDSSNGTEHALKKTELTKSDTNDSASPTA
jgi:hypothetical protein